MERETERNRKTDPSRRRGSGRSKTRPESEGEAERIRILAYEIYETRRSGGMLGDPVSDWLEAERRLNDAGTVDPAKGGTRRKRSER